MLAAHPSSAGLLHIDVAPTLGEYSLLETLSFKLVPGVFVLIVVLLCLII